MTGPADKTPVVETFDEMSDSDKLTYLCEHLTWLTTQVNNLLTAGQRNPALRFMMGRNK